MKIKFWSGRKIRLGVEKIDKSVPAEPMRSAIQRFFVLGISSGFGAGYMPVAPGTWGSIVGIPLGFLLLHLPNEVALALCIALFVFFSLLADRACRHWGNMDSQRVVSDEIIGQAISLYGLRTVVDPVTGLPPWVWVLAAFLLFRLFDIVKPYPARTFDRVKSGWGVVMDDVVAGLYVGLFLLGVSRLTLGSF